MRNTHLGKSVLYITYDGLLDPLGASQILPYVEGIAAHPRNVHILSFEKPFRLAAGRTDLERRLARLGITWRPLKFTSRAGFFGKVWDLARMYFFSCLIFNKVQPAVVHGRGHAATQVGLFLKRWRGPKLIFDFRGLWVDERIDKGGWDLRKPFDRWQYSRYKLVEKLLLQRADQIVVLTEAVIDEVLRLGVSSREKITVIPCCADFDHFNLAEGGLRQAARMYLGINQDAFVLGYLGSVGGMYLSNRYFRLLEMYASVDANFQGFVLTPDIKRFNEEMRRNLPSRLHGKINAVAGNRDDVAKLLPAADVLVSFIRPSYSRVATSPTKLAESFAAGIPALCNLGIGDVESLIQELDAGLAIDADSDNALAEVVKALPSLAAKGGARLRVVARESLGLEVANKRYRAIYQKLDLIC